LARPRLLHINEVTRDGWYFQPNTNKTEGTFGESPDGWFYEKTPEGWRSETGHLLEADVLTAEDLVTGPISFAKPMKAPAKLKYDECSPQAWRNKETGKVIKFLPWLQPISDSRMDFQALLRDLDLGFTDDMLADFKCYSGLVIHCGWQFENDNNIWISVHPSIEEHFEKLGRWSEHGTKPTTDNP
jgi:hypothetical protein